MRTSALQGPRVLFILSIIFMHAGMTVFGMGTELCSFFFVISGFLFAGKQVQTLPYIKKKLAKLYPVYLYFFLCQLAIQCCYTGTGCLNWRIVPHLLLIQSFHPRLGAMACYLVPAWFLSSIMFCWLCAPCIGTWMVRASRRKLVFALCAAICVYMALFAPPLKEMGSDGSWWAYLTYISPPYRLIEYFLGMGLGMLIKNVEYKQGNRFVELGVIVAYVLCIYFQIFKSFTTFAHLGFIAYVYSYRCDLANKLFGNSTMQWLAKYSMFFYLGHFPFATIIREHYGLSPMQAVALSLVVVTIMTWAFLSVQNFFRKLYGPQSNL